MVNTVDVGYPWNKRYVIEAGADRPGAHRIRHAVIRKADDSGEWEKVCDGKRATREYKGFVSSAVQCDACKEKLRA